MIKQKKIRPSKSSRMAARAKKSKREAMLGQGRSEDEKEAMRKRYHESKRRKREEGK